MWMRLLPLGLLLWFSSLSAQPPGRMWTFTYLKAHSGQEAALGQFLRRNWLAMDSTAKAQGLLHDYRLLQKVPADTAGWDFMVVVIYPDTSGFRGIQTAWQRIRQQHSKVLVDGKDLPQLGRIVRSEARLEWLRPPQ